MTEAERIAVLEEKCAMLSAALIRSDAAIESVAATVAAQRANADLWYKDGTPTTEALQIELTVLHDAIMWAVKRLDLRWSKSST